MPFVPGPVSANAGGAMKPNRSLLASVLLVCFSTGAAWSQNEGRQTNCSGLPTAGQLKQFLATAPSDGGDAGGLFHGTLMWAAVVNRRWQLCPCVESSGVLFFFQAEDGIRDLTVTGVQTCALPI